ncbi:MAG: IS1182 family transposase [Actinomycetia bacterium]|nr:IS1182 family transposase [Actinomycetes bacterium]
MQGRGVSARELLDAGALCGHLLDPTSMEAFLAQHRKALFTDDMFADLFRSGRGRPSIPADVIAVVMVLQADTGLSDRKAVARLRSDIGWKAACGLALDDAGFDSTVLVLWRRRLRDSADPKRIDRTVRGVVDATGVLAGKRLRALDSTVLDDAVARQDTITMLAQQIRRVRRMIPELAKVPVHDDNLDFSRPLCDWTDAADVDRVVSELTEDAFVLILAADELDDLSDAQAEAVGLLGVIVGQDVEEVDAAKGRWRIAKRVAKDRIVSTVDTQSRHTHKTSHSYRDGYKAHIAAEPDTGIITASTLTAGNTSDADAAPDLIADEGDDIEVLGDSAYGTGEFRKHLDDREIDSTIKPPPLRTAVEGGFSLDDFAIDEQAGTVTCPEQITVTIRETKSGRIARFGAHCRQCPVQHLCTRAKAGRTIKIHEHHALLARARSDAQTDEFADLYRQKRPLVERSIAWITRARRRLPYRGLERNQLALTHRVAAVNLKRLITLGLTHHPHHGWTLTPT